MATCPGYVAGYVAFTILDPMLSDSDSWSSLLSDSELSSQGLETKKYPCKYQDCRKSFNHSQSRSKHYRKEHAPNMPPKKDPTYNVTVNLLPGDDYQIVEEQPQQIRASPQIKEAISLCQSFFNRENTETAIAMIKGSTIVQENALEMR